MEPTEVPQNTRAWARGNAIGAISTSVLGNALYHAAEAHVLAITWPVVVALSAIPPIALGLTVHLWHVADDHEPEPEKRSPGPAIAEPETVHAAYPILGTLGALATPPAQPAKRTPAAAPSALAAGAPGAPRTGSGAPATAAPVPRPAAPPATAGGAGRPSARPAAAPRRESREERLARLRAEALPLNVASIARGEGPISARGLARELHINQDTAREIVRTFQAGNPSPQRGPTPASGPAPLTPNALRAPAAAHPGPTGPRTPGAPQHPATSAPATTPSAPEPPGPSAPASALPDPRTAPLAPANGAPVETP